jgi:diguanylate cyclase
MRQMLAGRTPKHPFSRHADESCGSAPAAILQPVQRPGGIRRFMVREISTHVPLDMGPKYQVQLARRIVIQSHNVEDIDPASTVITKMREQGISSLPRNYALVYEFLNTTDADFIKEFGALGSRPTQLQLDEIGKKFLPHHHGMTVVEETRQRVSGEIKGLIRLYRQDQAARRQYSDLLGNTCSRISAKTASGPVGVDALVEVLSSATGDNLEKAEAFVRQLVERADEMAQVRSELEEYKRLATIDAITGLSNRRAFDERLSEIYMDPFGISHHALLVADIDHFKKFNDTYGHQVGDRVLSAVAGVMKNSLSEETFVARTGGEEFAIVLSGTTADIATGIADRIRLVVEKTSLKDHSGGLDCGRITITFGLCMASDAAGPEDLYGNADMALYAAKNNGRNQIRAFDRKMKMKKMFRFKR